MSIHISQFRSILIHNAIQFDNNFDSFSFDRDSFGDISIIISISLIHEKIHCMFLIHSK